VNGERGPYLTRNREAELRRDLVELEQRLTARIDELQAETRRLLGFPHTLAKLQAGATIEAVRLFTEGGSSGNNT
jgi:hypothetical protein